MSKSDYDKIKESEIKKGSLYYLIGLPRSGKSTFCNNWIAEKPNRIVLNADNFRLALHTKGYIHESEDMVNTVIFYSVKALLLSGYEVLVDDTHTRLESRYRWDRIGGKQIYIDTPLEICLSRVVGSDEDEEISGFKNAMKVMADNLKKHPPKK